MTTRRNFLALLGSLSASACWMQGEPARDHGNGNTKRQMPDAHATPSSSGEELDEALEMLAPFGPSFRGGLSNHGPMTAEALVSLGRSDAVVVWVDRYRKRLDVRPVARERITSSNWREALGDRARVRDWDEWFKSELSESPWPAVLEVWVPRLAPGMAAAGLHSVIRTGHAVHSLAVRENAARLDELARALGYWAAHFLRLPGELTRAGELPPALAFREVALLPAELRKSRGLITTELKDLVGFEPFAESIGLVDPTAGAPDFMAEMLAGSAGVFLNTRSSSFEFLHAVTGAGAVAALLPHVKLDERASVMAYNWQVTAAIHSRYGRKGLGPKTKPDSHEWNAKRLADLAVATGDEHTIKLTAACTREWQRNADPRLLAAAAKRIG